jgi:agmatine/peptidylarginine deiminase
MPMLLKHIDAIAREKQRDVLFLSFPPAEQRANRTPYEQIESRKQIIAWLDAHQVKWLMCGDVANENVMRSYAGQIYIDARYDPNDPSYQALQEFLEYPDGNVRFDGVRFWIVSLELAMKNAHHDEPGFWEKWAEDF